MILDAEMRLLEPEITLVALSGRMTLGNRLTEVEHSIKGQIEHGCRKLILDLTRLDFLDSAGVGMLVMCAGAIGQVGGEIRIAGASARVAQVFEVTHIARLIPIFATVEDARHSFAAGAGA